MYRKVPKMYFVRSVELPSSENVSESTKNVFRIPGGPFQAKMYRKVRFLVVSQVRYRVDMQKMRFLVVSHVRHASKMDRA